MAVQTGDAAARVGTRRRLGALGRRSATWVLGVLVVSLVLPAVTKQWSDNQQQHQLKSDLTSRLAAAVAGATTDGGFLLGNQLQLGTSRAATLAAYQSTLERWKSEAAAIDAEIAGYFATTRDPDKDDVVIAMRAYDSLVQDFLGYCAFFKDAGARARFLHEFELNLMKMRTHVPGVPANVVPPLVARSQPRPVGRFKEEAQNQWAQNVVNASAPIIVIVSRRQPRGLHVGAEAFFHQVFHPFG